MSKENYQTLKNKLAQNILEELNSNEEDPSNTKEYLIETIIPEIADINGNNNISYEKNNEIPNLNQKKLHMQVHKLNLTNTDKNQKGDNDLNTSEKKKKTKKVNLNKDEELDRWDEKGEENDEESQENKNDSAKKSIKQKNENNELKDDTRKYYSDALQLFNELSNKNDVDNDENEQKNNEDNLFIHPKAAN